MNNEMVEYLDKNRMRAEVVLALREDLADANCDSLDLNRDLSAQLLGDKRDELVTATLKSNDAGVLCGTAWFNEAVQLCARLERLDWHYQDGDKIEAGAKLCTILGTKGGLLTAERTAINFVQLLSGIATRSRAIANQVEAARTELGLDTAAMPKILDTRKSIPNLRHAQKYAVRVGGCHNHRFTLNDAIMIKENHIIAAGGVPELVQKITQVKENNKSSGDLPVILEVENLEQVNRFFSVEISDAPEVRRVVDVVMLDNFSIDMIKQAVAVRTNFSKLGREFYPAYEVSGEVTPANLKDYLGLGVERISMGYLTKDYTALDLSLRFSDS